jgi:hypothetical protein
VSQPYAVDFTAKAADQTRGLDPQVYEAMNATLVAIARDPWGQTSPDRLESSPAYRWASFGEAGWVHVYVDDHARVVRVHDVTWIG